MTNPVAPVERQVLAYNAHDLDAFCAEYTSDVRVFRMPDGTTPVLAGIDAFRAHYAAKRFNRPDLQAQIVSRIVCGNKVIDHERVTGIEPHPVEIVAVYEVTGERISTVWFFPPA